MQYLKNPPPSPTMLATITPGTALYGVIADYKLIDEADLKEGAMGHADLYIVGCFAQRTTHRFIAAERRWKGQNEGDFIAAVRSTINRLVAGWRGTFHLSPFNHYRPNIFVVRDRHAHYTPLDQRLAHIRYALVSNNDECITPEPYAPTGTLRTVTVKRQFYNTRRRVDLGRMTEQEAQAWCADPESGYKLCVFDESLGRTAKNGEWADHYYA